MNCLETMVEAGGFLAFLIIDHFSIPSGRTGCNNYFQMEYTFYQTSEGLKITKDALTKSLKILIDVGLCMLMEKMRYLPYSKSRFY